MDRLDALSRELATLDEMHARLAALLAEGARVRPRPLGSVGVADLLRGTRSQSAFGK